MAKFIIPPITATTKSPIFTLVAWMSPEWDWGSFVFAVKVGRTPDFVVKSGVLLYGVYNMLIQCSGIIQCNTLHYNEASPPTHRFRNSLSFNPKQSERNLAFLYDAAQIATSLRTGRWYSPANRYFLQKSPAHHHRRTAPAWTHPWSFPPR